MSASSRQGPASHNASGGQLSCQTRARFPGSVPRCPTPAAIYMSVFVDRLTRTTNIELLRGEWPTTHASGVRLHDTDYFPDLTWRNTEAGADTTDGRRAACHVWIRPIVDVKHQRVCALDENPLATGQCLVYIHDTVNDERA